TESVLPGLCGASFASEEKVTARRVVDATYFPVGPPPQLPEGTFSESITTYEQGGAEQFLTEVRAAVTACPTDSDQVVPLRYTTVEENLSADDAITIIEEGTYTLVGNTRVESRRPIRVIRVGDSVLVLGFHSWEHLSFDQAIADA